MRTLTVSRSSRQLLATLALLSLIAAPVLAQQRQADEPLAFVAVPGVGASVAAMGPVHQRRPRSHRAMVRPVPGYPIPPKRPTVRLPANPPRLVVIKVDPRPLPGSGGHAGTAIRGTASYYCNADPSRGRTSRCTVGHPDVGGDQLYAAIRRDLLDKLRGHHLRVCATGSRRCVEVQVIDCNCGPSANLIDLYADALERLVPVSRGTVNVVISW